MTEPVDELREFKRRDAASYEDVTDPFDRYTQQYSDAIAGRVIEVAAPRPGARILDVGCGTGIVTFKAARAAGPTGLVVGLDLSEGMLAKARAKASANPELLESSAPLQFLSGDAEALPFDDAAFDGIVSLYALRHFPDPAAALSQMQRVLIPGGRAVVAVGSGPRLRSIAGLRAAVRRLRELAGLKASRHDLLACGCLDELVQQHLPPLPGGEEADWTHHHAVGASVSSLMRRAGFTRIRVQWTGHEGVVDSVDAFWELQATFSSLARKRLESAPADAVAELRRAFEAKCAAARAAGGRLRYPTGALIFTGIKRS